MNLILEDCFLDIHCVLVTQVNDQKTPRQLTIGVFFSYKSAVVNYRWGYFSLLLVFLGSIESQKSNCLDIIVNISTSFVILSSLQFSILLTITTFDFCTLHFTHVRGSNLIIINELDHNSMMQRWP